MLEPSLYRRRNTVLDVSCRVRLFNFVFCCIYGEQLMYKDSNDDSEGYDEKQGMLMLFRKPNCTNVSATGTRNYCRLDRLW